ncbi:hypothetical protein WN944_006813 [Citrus x changshan-huyou]|uniref:CSC1/OSCA1-like N-terminal transmembrane domain-containing protein n=1 Tax=Citrus x changshan-huyou TaxID=2935761 RepID=A0AAP0QU69_9ROSI
MDVSALLTSAGINISVTSLLLCLYSILRKQSCNLSVYFGKRLASVGNRLDDSFSLERFASSSSWIVKAWETSEDEILAIGGMDAVIIIRIIVFSFIDSSAIFWSTAFESSALLLSFAFS